LRWISVIVFSTSVQTPPSAQASRSSPRISVLTVAGFAAVIALVKCDHHLGHGGEQTIAGE
jgi:hypothetical protein